jgi:hypothetical protein
MTMRDGSGWRERPPILRFGVAAILALSCWLAPIPASAQTETPLTLTLRGDESPETVRKLVEALSVGGRKVEIRIANAATPADAAAAASNPTSPSPKSASAPVQPSAPVEPPTMAGSRLEMIWDHFVAGFDYGNAAIPRIVELPGDWSRAWAQNLNGKTGLSAGLRVLACLVVAFGAALLFRRATASWFARRLHPSGVAFTPRLIASSYGLLQDLACIAVLLAVGRLTRGLWLPADDLALITFRTVGNGAAIGAAYIAAARRTSIFSAPSLCDRDTGRRFECPAGSARGEQP